MASAGRFPGRRHRPQTEDGWRFTVRGVPVEIASLSRHDIGNALAALAVADALGVPLADAAHALRAYAPPPMRMQVVKTASGVTVLNDAYNAAPASVQERPGNAGRLPRRPQDRLSGRHARAGRAGGRGAPRTRRRHRRPRRPGRALHGRRPGRADPERRAAVRGQRRGRPVRPRGTARSSRATSILVKGSRAMAMEKIVAALAPPPP